MVYRLPYMLRNVNINNNIHEQLIGMNNYIHIQSITHNKYAEES